MSRRKKDPLRELTDDGAAGPDPAQPVAGRPGRRGHPGQDPPGRRRRRRLPGRGPRRRPPLRRRRLPPGRPLQRRGPGRPDAPPRRRAAADLRPGGPRADRGRGRPGADPRGRRHRDLVALDPAAGAPRGPRRPAAGLDLHHPARPPRVRLQLPAHPHLVPDRHGPAPPQGRAGGRHRPGRRREKRRLLADPHREGRASGKPFLSSER